MWLFKYANFGTGWLPEQEDKGVIMYHVEVVNGGGTGFNVTSNNYKFSVDTQGEGISPQVEIKIT